MALFVSSTMFLLRSVNGDKSFDSQSSPRVASSLHFTLSVHEALGQNATLYESLTDSLKWRTEQE